MDTVYLWHGRGSSAQERQTALWYAQSIMNKGVSPIELSEGENDDDEMFWMILGDEAYANAHYWRWRKKSSATDPSVWRVDSNLGSQPVSSHILIYHDYREAKPHMSTYRYSLFSQFCRRRPFIVLFTLLTVSGSHLFSWAVKLAAKDEASNWL